MQAQDFNNEEARKTLYGQFSVLVKQDGWKVLQQKFADDLAQFVNDIMVSDQPLTDFENRRRELMGQRKFLGEVSETLKHFEFEKEKDE